MKTAARRAHLGVRNVTAVGWLLGVESLLIGMLAPTVPAFEALQNVLPVGATSGGVAVAVLLGWFAVASAVSLVVTMRRDLT